jgi:hypothetical protein
MENLTEIIEQLSDFKQELAFVMRSTHCLIQDTESLNEELIMGMLHSERRLLDSLNLIIESVND